MAQASGLPDCPSCVQALSGHRLTVCILFRSPATVFGQFMTVDSEWSTWVGGAAIPGVGTSQRSEEKEKVRNIPVLVGIQLPPPELMGRKHRWMS